MSFIEVLKEIMGIEHKVITNTIKDPAMLNTLKDLFKKEISLVQTTKLSAMVLNLLNEFNADLLKDGNSRDAAIDCIIQLLHSEKSAPPPIAGA